MKPATAPATKPMHDLEGDDCVWPFYQERKCLSRSNPRRQHYSYIFVVISAYPGHGKIRSLHS